MTKKPAPKKKSSTPSKSVAKGLFFTRALTGVKGEWSSMQSRRRALLARRPHRSLQRTRRRDYVRTLDMPGYWSFTAGVLGTMRKHRKLFSWTVAVYAIFTIILVGIGSQATYVQFGDELRSSGSQIFEGNWSELNQATMLLLGGVSGSINSTPTETQQIYGVLLTLLLWLTVVWLLRAIAAGRTPRFRDGLYNAGAPIVSTALVALVALIQLAPVALAAIGFSIAAAAGLLSGGVEAMIFWLFAILLAVLSLYWLTSTFIAMIVVTLPGMRPMQALKTAGDLVIGRRLRVLLRLLWLGLLIVVLWVAVMLPLILLDTWVKGMLPSIEWMPVVPLGLVIISSLSVTVAASYVYLLYRRIVDDESAPA